MRAAAAVGESARATPGIRLFGDFAVRVGSRMIADTDWRLRRARALVKLLALAPGHRLHREQIVDLLWPDLETAASANTLHQTLHAARRALGDAAPLPGWTRDCSWQQQRPTRPAES